MPVTIQPATLRYKNGDGQFQTADCIKGDIGDPSIIIDDTAGSGDTGKVWSADKVSSELDGKLDSTLKGAANGIAELDQTGKVPSSQLPSYVDDVLEYASLASFPQEGESGKIYVSLDTNKTYRWGGSAYAEISESLALGETSTTAYRGDRGAAAYAAAVTNVETTPTQNSTNLITSGAVYTGLDGKVDKAGAITDVQVNGTTVVTNSVANVPMMSANSPGVAKISDSGSFGVSLRSDGNLQVEPSSDGVTKAGQETRKPIVPYRQHIAAFYGLAKAAGDTTQLSSDNPVGQYTPEALNKIQDMLGIDEKADYSPKYGTPVADVADRLVSDKYTEDNTPYLMRKAPDAEFDEETLVGGTVCWNQQIANGNFENTIGWSGQNSTKSANNNIISCTLTSVYSSNPLYRDYTSATVGHKYLATCDVYSPKATSARWQYSSVATGISIVSIPANTWKNVSNIFSQTDVSLFLLYYCIDPCSLEVGDTVQFRNYMVFDLTQMFGSTIADYIYTLEQNTAGAGVAFFRNLFPKAYYAYDAGSLQSVQAGSRVIGGFNLLKTQPTNPNNYAAITFNENAVTKVKAGYEYQYSFDISNATSWRTALIIWDLNGNRLEESTPTVNAQKAFSTKDAAFYAFNGGTANPVYYVQSANNTAQNMYFTFNQDCYVMFYYGFGDTSASTVLSNVCLNLKGEGDYEPYREPVSYPFDTSLTLRGLPKLDNGRLYYDGDEYKADGTVTRKYGIVDLGTLDWILHSNNANRQAWITTWISSSMKGAPDGDTAINAFATNAYAVSYNASWIPYTISTNTTTSSNLIYCVETDKYDSGSAFKTAMSGIYLVYELATPTIESAAPFTPLQEVFPNGTEQFTEWGTRDVEIPVGHKSKYSNNHKTEIDKDISTLYNNKADAIFKSESDVAIANFTDGADDMSVKSMVVDINPVQDLHGQSSPWPAGGNVNQFGVDTVTPATGSTCYGLTVVTDTTNGTISLSGTPSWTVGGNKQFRLFYQNNSYSKSLKAKYFVVSKSANVTSVYEYPLSADNTDALAINIDVTDNNELSLVVKPVVYSGNTSPSAWTPTSNICPITGWTRANVTRTGKNLFNVTERVENQTNAAGDVSSGYTLTNGVLTITKDLSNYGRVMMSAMRMKAGTYTLSFAVSISGSGRISYSIRDMGANPKDDIVGNTGTTSASVTKTFTLASDSDIAISIQPEGSATGTISISNIQIEFGSTATAYEPYIGTTYPISFESAGTVYGGTLDVTTGVLTVTMKSVDLGTLTWEAGTTTTNGAYRWYAPPVDSAKKPANANTLSNILCSAYMRKTGMETYQCVDGVSFGQSDGKIYLYDSALKTSTAQQVATALSGVYLVYELATPITYKLDPTTITTLLGTNNIFADTGNVSLTYPCDTKAYIDQNEGVKDVQINGTSITTNGVANVPIATTSHLGVVKVGDGFSNPGDGTINVDFASADNVKAGTTQRKSVTPYQQHRAVFYGLAKAAGDTTQASSANAVGAYTEDAKRKITDMIEPQFRKIAEITTENNQGAVYINTDLNGDPFELTDVIIDFNMTASSGNGRGFLIFNQPNSNPSNTDDLYTTIPNLACDNLYNNSGTRRNIEHVWISGGRFFGVSQDGAMGNYSQTGQQRMCVASSGIIAVDKIRSIRTYSNNGCTFGNNSVITVYGR